MLGVSAYIQFNMYQQYEKLYNFLIHIMITKLNIDNSMCRDQPLSTHQYWVQKYSELKVNVDVAWHKSWV